MGKRADSARHSLEGLVHWSVPAEEGAGCKEDQPEDGEAKVYTGRDLRGEESQAGEKVEEQGYAVDCGRREGAGWWMGKQEGC